MTDYADLEKRLRVMAADKYELGYSVTSTAEEAADALASLRRERDALLTTAAALGDLEPAAVLQHVRDSIAANGLIESQRCGG